jgi:hypothetical protein
MTVNGQLHAPAASPGNKIPPCCPLSSGLFRVYCRTGGFRKGTNPLSVPGIKRRFHGRLTLRTTRITTGLTRLCKSQVCDGVVKSHSPKSDSEKWFRVLAVVLLKITMFWEGMPCALVNCHRYWRFGGEKALLLLRCFAVSTGNSYRSFGGT